MRKITGILAALVMAGLSSQAHALAMGDTVTCSAVGYTCGQSSATVNSGVEFNIGQPGFLGTTPAFTADFSNGMLTLTSLLNATNLGSYVLKFADTTNPITSASLSSITGVSVGLAASDVSVAAGLLSVDFSNTVIVPSTTYRIAINQAATPPAAVPETSTWAMMMVGFGTIGAALRRRRSTALALA